MLVSYLRSSATVGIRRLPPSCIQPRTPMKMRRPLGKMAWWPTHSARIPNYSGTQLRERTAKSLLRFSVLSRPTLSETGVHTRRVTFTHAIGCHADLLFRIIVRRSKSGMLSVMYLWIVSNPAWMKSEERWLNVLWLVSRSGLLRWWLTVFQDFLIDDKEFVSNPEWSTLNPTLPLYI